jgi:acyl-coenzyme A synthetase/AMP-(fatty) acid ligase
MRRTIPEAISQQVARRSDHIALRTGERSLTYAELGHVIAAAAHHHSFAQTPTANAPVTVIAPLGSEGLVLHLAVLAAGRICAPFETSRPIDSLLSTVRTVGGPVLCLDSELTMTLTAAGVECIPTEDLVLDALLNQPRRDLPSVNTDPDSAALLCFTSGSTGSPKGVLIPHSRLLESAEFSGSVEDDIIAITSPPSFFSSTMFTLMALSVGATGVHLDLATTKPARLRAAVLDLGLTYFPGTTTHVRELARSSFDDPITSIRAIDLGGEPTTRADIELARRVFPNARIRNTYGSAEAGRITHIDIGPDDALPPPGPIPAGRPDPAGVLEVFGPDNHPVVAGETGRIAVRRRIPFLGYWNDPERTAAVGLTDSEGLTWILSGDFGHVNNDGVLIVEGRVDDLVKIRGRFVNPTAVDTILLADPRVRSAITIAVPPDAPDRLRSFVVSEDCEVSSSDLRRLVAQTLALHELPRDIVFVNKLPTTDRGKIDRSALLTIEIPPSLRSGDSIRSGRSTTERQVLKVMCEILDFDLSATDDFLDAGGDSLTAVEFLHVLTEDFGLELTPAQFVADPTAAGVTRLLEARSRSVSPEGLLTLHDGDHPTTAFWLLGNDKGFGPARLAQRTAPIRSAFVRVVGHDGGPPLPSITAIGVHNADVIHRNRTEHTVLIGYSAGARLALETASTLADRGVPPDLVFLIDPPTKETEQRDRELPSLLRHPRQFIGALLQRRRIKRRPFDAEDPDIVLWRVLHRHRLLANRHTLRPYQGPTVLILTEQFEEVGGPSTVSEALTGTVTKIVVPGNHNSVLLDVEPLANAITEVLRDRGLL